MPLGGNDETRRLGTRAARGRLHSSGLDWRSDACDHRRQRPSRVRAERRGADARLDRNNEDSNQTGSASAISYGAAPAAAATMTFSYGIADNTDLEIPARARCSSSSADPDGRLDWHPPAHRRRRHVRYRGLGEDWLGVELGEPVSTSSGDEESSARPTARSRRRSRRSTAPARPARPNINLMPATINRDPSDADPFKVQRARVVGGDSRCRWRSRT